MDECGIYAQVIYPNAVGIGGQNLAKATCRPRAAPPVRRDLQRLDGRAAGVVEQPLPADAGPARVEHRRVRRRGGALSPTLGFRGVNMTSDPQEAGSPDLASKAWDAALGGVRRPAPARALPHRRQPDLAQLLRAVLLAVAARQHEAGGRRLDALPQQRPRGDQQRLRRHLRPAPEAEDGVGGERHRLDPVHPRDDGLRDPRERAASRRPSSPASRRSTSRTTGTRRSGSSATRGTCRA